MKLILRNVTKKYKQKVVDNYSCHWEEPGIYYLTGPSGSGKSTLLRIMAGIEKDFTGEVIRDGKIAMVFQEPRLFPEVTLLENVACVLNDNDENNQIAKELLAKVGLGDDLDKKAKEASGGMQQRTAFARALAVNPDILLCDEPFSSQDEDNKKIMEDMLCDVSKKAIVVITKH